MSNNVDKKIKDSLNKNKEQVPKKIDDSIENTLKGLKRNRNYKKQIGIASIMIAAFMITLVGIESYATRNKIQSDIFDEFNISENYKEYGLKIDKKLKLSEDSPKEIKEKEVKIESIVYDGYTVVLSYEIRGMEDEIDSINWKMIDDAEQIFDTQIGSFQKEKNNIKGVVTSQVKDRKDSLDLEILAEINGEKYILKEKIKVAKTKNAIREVRINKNLDGNIIKKLIITPMYIYLEGKPSKDMKDGESIKIETLEGKEIPWSSSEINGKFKIKTKFNSMYINSYKNIEGIRIKGKEKSIVVTEKGQVYEEKVKSN